MYAKEVNLFLLCLLANLLHRGRLSAIKKPNFNSMSICGWNGGLGSMLQSSIFAHFR
jgi:hypothetical protein